MDKFARRLAAGYDPDSPFSNHLDELDAVAARDGQRMQRDSTLAKQGYAFAGAIELLHKVANLDNTSVSLLNLAIFYEQAQKEE